MMNVIIRSITPVAIEKHTGIEPVFVKTEYILVDFTLKNEVLTLKGELQLNGKVDEIDLSLPNLRETVLRYVKHSI